MFATASKNDDSQVAKIPRASVIKGNFLLKEDLEVGGLIDGNVFARNVWIHESGRVDGAIFADQIVVLGEVCGSIEARNIMLASGAKVTGDLFFAEIIRIEDGAHHDGITVRTAGGLVSGTIRH